jgi:hypothetical protein
MAVKEEKPWALLEHSCILGSGPERNVADSNPEVALVSEGFDWLGVSDVDGLRINETYEVGAKLRCWSNSVAHDGGLNITAEGCSRLA